mmetsp:Transcript_21879/g.35822  ORF Transcript_21879/g.35822 Transcript_21879/m.35822 type:complete len:232 (+) Transcript_21879:2287-2982(+)
MCAELTFLFNLSSFPDHSHPSLETLRFAHALALSDGDRWVCFLCYLLCLPTWAIVSLSILWVVRDDVLSMFSAITSKLGIIVQAIIITIKEIAQLALSAIHSRWVAFPSSTTHMHSNEAFRSISVSSFEINNLVYIIRTTLQCDSERVARVISLSTNSALDCFAILCNDLRPCSLFPIFFCGNCIESNFIFFIGIFLVTIIFIPAIVAIATVNTPTSFTANKIGTQSMNPS